MRTHTSSTNTQLNCTVSRHIIKDVQLVTTVKIGERHLRELTGQQSEIKRTKERNKTDIRSTTCNPFERKLNGGGGEALSTNIGPDLRINGRYTLTEYYYYYFLN